MKRRSAILAGTAIALTVFAAVRFGIVQAQKGEALAYLAQYGELEDWQFLGHPFDRLPSISPWLPGVWPQLLAINSIPPDPSRYADAAGKLPSLDEIEVFVDKPMSIDIFAVLGAVHGVRTLYLASDSVTDAALQKFTQFGTVEELLLEGSRITDASINQILKFRHARVLNLYGELLSDAQVLELAQMPALRDLDLDDRTPLETLAALRAKRPDLKVSQYLQVHQ